MNIISQLAIKSLKHRKFTLVLSISSIALSVILMLGVERIRHQIHESFSSTIAGTDLIVGSRTGSVSLLLSSVFHIGFPNQNVQFSTYNKIKANPRVAWTIPFSLGDSHQGYPVLGSSSAYFEHFLYGQKQSLEAGYGTLSIENMDAVVGAKIAKVLNYQVGDSIIVAHGMGKESFVKHAGDPFIIKAILKPTGTPVDQTIHVSLVAMHKVHQIFEGHNHHHHDALEEALCLHSHGDDEPTQLTGFMLGLNNKSDILAMQRMLNTYKDEPLTAIMPVVTLMELWAVVGPMEKALLSISFLVLLVSFFGMLTTIMTSLNERRREMAILRSVGAKSKHIFQLIVMESVAVTLSGVVIGLIILNIILLLIKPLIATKLGIVISLHWFSLSEFSLLGIILLGGLCIGFIPAYRSYKNSLADGLTIKN